MAELEMTYSGNLSLAAGGTGVSREASFPDISEAVVRGKKARIIEADAQNILEWLSASTKSWDSPAAARQSTDMEVSLQGCAPLRRPADVGSRQRRVFEVQATPSLVFSALCHCFEEQRPAEILTIDDKMLCFTAMTFEDFVALHVEVKVFASGIGAVVVPLDLGRTDTVLFHKMLDSLSKVLEPIGLCDSMQPSCLLDFDDDDFDDDEDFMRAEVGVVSWHEVLAPLFLDAVKVSPKRVREYAWQTIARLSKSEPACHVAMAELVVTKCRDLIAVAFGPGRSAQGTPLAETYPMAAALSYASRTSEAAEKMIVMDIFSQALRLPPSLPRCLRKLVGDVVSRCEEQLKARVLHELGRAQGPEAECCMELLQPKCNVEESELCHGSGSDKVSKAVRAIVHGEVGHSA
eukprot:CAMPEP_0203908660 /NCGR_PEP_ID=MMETSP0359-20131031/50050_1 /ASSEMBLY_ACC=CAM_ASM_000338 /TAXON_ID=268821 /ORGANISM="Scrippsiella Hangoei, Strain SHTV-5" /LENGTH=405 /DNA_ID=CAMNT_0050833731 /DNA_START=81 /DNA_END=1298 /DNA_ORIENTATION=+